MGTAPVADGGAVTDVPASRAPDPDGESTRWAVFLQLLVFAGVGFLFNLVYAGLFVGLRDVADAQWANAISLVLSTIAGTAGHRRLTFGVRGRARAVRHQALGLGMLAFGLAVTASSLWLLEVASESPTRRAELAVLVGANLFVGLVRFLAFRSAMVPATPSQ